MSGHDPKNGSHSVADHLMMTGHPLNASLPFPCFGSVVARQRGYNGAMVPFVQLGRHIDRRFNGGIAGFLGDEFNAFEVPDDPSRPNFTVRDLSVADGHALGWSGGTPCSRRSIASTGTARSIPPR